MVVTRAADCYFAACSLLGPVRGVDELLQILSLFRGQFRAARFRSVCG